LQKLEKGLKRTKLKQKQKQITLEKQINDIATEKETLHIQKVNLEKIEKQQTIRTKQNVEMKKQITAKQQQIEQQKKDICSKLQQLEKLQARLEEKSVSLNVQKEQFEAAVQNFDQGKMKIDEKKAIKHKV
jgi:hypothetical protein